MASGDPELAEMLKQVNLNVQPQIPRYEDAHGLYSPSDEMNQAADIYGLPDFFRQFQYKTPQLKAPTVQLATNPLGQAGPASPEHMEEILRHEILGHGNQFGKQIENIRDSKSVVDAGTLMQASKRWPNLKGAYNSGMHHKDWERYAASPERLTLGLCRCLEPPMRLGTPQPLRGCMLGGLLMRCRRAHPSVTSTKPAQPPRWQQQPVRWMQGTSPPKWTPSVTSPPTPIALRDP